MAKKEDIRRYTADELAEMRRKGLSQTDWAKVDAMSEEELEASIAADPDDVHEPLDWTKAIKGLPPRKAAVKLRIDEDVLGWFKSTGKGYQTRMNNVLRAFFESRGGRAGRERAVSRPPKKPSVRAKQDRRRRA
jgi:uncharacterized protein (DUF4415 family)